MNKGLIGFSGAIVLLVLLAVVLGNSDPITPAIVEARSATSVGVTAMDVINDGLALVAKLILGATVAGALSFLWIQGGKLYRRWWSNQLTRRWKPGPNANYQQQGPRAAKLTREDLLFMALANRDGRIPGARSTRLSSRANQQETDNENEIDINL